MITPPADIYVALQRPSIRKRIRATWTLRNGQVIDLTNRLTSVGAVTRTLRAAMGGYRISGLHVKGHNGDGFFTPSEPTSPLHFQKRTDYLDSSLLIEQGVEGRTSGWYYFPVYTGQVLDIIRAKGLASLKCADGLARTAKVPLPVDHPMRPGIGAVQLRTLMTDHTELVTADFESAPFNASSFTQQDMNWITQGVVTAGTSVFDAATAIGRSSMTSLYPSEDGKLIVGSEFPRDWGLVHRAIQEFPDEITDYNAWGFQTREAIDQIASGIKVQYSGVSADYINWAKEAELGYAKIKTVKMPFCALHRQAAWAARYLYEMIQGYLDVVRFNTHGIGLMMQLNDRLKINSVESGVTGTFRVTSKRWTRKQVTIEAVREWHNTTIIDATHAKESSTAWGSATEKAL